jgi:hypothetical protein
MGSQGTALTTQPIGSIPPPRTWLPLDIKPCSTHFSHVRVVARTENATKIYFFHVPLVGQLSYTGHGRCDVAHGFCGVWKQSSGLHRHGQEQFRQLCCMPCLLPWKFAPLLPPQPQAYSLEIHTCIPAYPSHNTVQYAQSYSVQHAEIGRVFAHMKARAFI